MSDSSALLLRAAALAFDDGMRSAESLSRFLQESLELPPDAPDLKELLAFLRGVEVIH